MSIDKSSERNARAALLKLKQKEQVCSKQIYLVSFPDGAKNIMCMWLSTQCIQEVKNKARKQFKGLFDRKPGEISEAGNVDKSDQTAAEIPGNDTQDDTDFTKKDDIVEDALEATPPTTRFGLLSHLWSTRKNLFISSAIQMLVMLAIVYLIKRLL